MATLIRRPGSKFWIACYDVILPDGSRRRLKKSTKRTKRSEATTEAVRMEEADNKVTTATDETAARAYAILQEAAAIAARGQLTEGRAREIVARLALLSTGEQLRFFTVREWSEEWLGMKQASRKASSVTSYRASLSAFLSWLGDKADGRLEALTKADIRKFRADFASGWTPDRKTKKHPRAAATTNLALAAVSSMLRAAVREGLLLSSPAAALEPLPNLDATKREVFTLQEVSAMIDAAPSEDWQGMILLGFYTGARIGDCSRMTWGNINRESKVISFTPKKTDRHRKKLSIPIHPRLAAWLDTREAGEDGNPLFPSLVSVNISGGGGLSLQFAGIMEAAGIDRKQTKGENGGRLQHARSFHSLRHSLTSALANLDIPEEIRRRITGHESAEIHAGYTHFETETMAAAVGKLPSL